MAVRKRFLDPAARTLLIFDIESRFAVEPNPGAWPYGSRVEIARMHGVSVPYVSMVIWRKFDGQSLTPRADRRAKIARLRKTGMSMRSIGAIVGVSYQTVFRALKAQRQEPITRDTLRAAS